MKEFIIKDKTLLEYCDSNNGNVMIPAGVERIDRDVFKGCRIESIVFPDGLKEIGIAAFEGCKRIKKLDLPESVEVVDCLAFGDCINLEEVITHSSSIRYGSMAFLNSPKLEDDGRFIVVNQQLFSCRSEASTAYVPEGVEIIHHGAFYRTHVKRIVLSESVKQLNMHSVVGPSIKEIIFLGDTPNIHIHAVQQQGVTIYAGIHSRAHEFAKGMNIPFIPINDLKDYEQIFEMKNDLNNK